MSRRDPTPEQRAAIDAAGEVLVSASAGSGKTFVMIEKIIALILRGEAETSSVLAVTFTNLAAGEMKERLRAALVERINAETDAAARARLKAQLGEIATADICTVHAFCTNVIRRYFYESDVAGNFRVADESEASKLRLRAVDLTFDRLLEEKSEGFALLCRLYAGGRGFDRLRKLLLEAYARTVVRGEPTAVLQGVPALYCRERFEALERELFAPVRERAARLERTCAALEEEAKTVLSPAVAEKYAAFLRERAAYAAAVAAAEDVFAAASVPPPAGRKPSAALLKKEGAAAPAFDGRVAALKEEFAALSKGMGGQGEREAEFSLFLRSGKPAAAMCELLSVFDEVYSSLKRRANALDFNDLERKCLALLEKPSVRAEVAGRYTHVFVDEYQDVNPVQERILALVAGENVFMVGDAKQSIYGFRGCSAAFFAQKFAKLQPLGRALTLNGNFRSGGAVLDAVNDIFSAVMTSETGSVDYAGTSVMTPGNPAAPRGAAHVVLVPPAEKAVREERGVYSVAEHLEPSPDEEYAEGAAIASVVGQCVADGKYGYGDIVVLTRNKQGKAGRIVAELVRRGIPVAAQAEINVCDYPEVKTLLDILRYLDNSSQDIPLASALKSAAGRLTDEELANIRLLAGGKESFSSACELYVRQKADDTAQKLRAFFVRCDGWRLRANVCGAAELLTRILSETGMEADLLALPAGAERVRRVRRLIAECGELDLSAFLQALKTGGNFIGSSERGGEDAVRVMTMHASKGLEFPVVIVAGMNAPFNSDDLSGVLYDDEWAFAFPAYDPENFVASETVLRGALRNRILRRRAEDEMRLLYVALTRAERELWMVFTKRTSFSPERVAAAKCFADFIDLDRLEDRIEPVFGGEVSAPATRVLSFAADEEARRAVAARYRQAYPFAASLRLPVKTSPTALLRARDAAGSAWSAEEEEAPLGEADAETGTAYHAFLERADFFAPPAQEAARLEEVLRAEGFTCLRAAQMQSILEMPVFASLRGWDLRRECAFLTSVPARELYAADADDPVLVQGVIDLLARRGEECVIVDYKYSAHGTQYLLETYAPQVRLYAAAAAKLPGVHAVRAVLVNILRGEQVEVPITEHIFPDPTKKAGIAP